METIEEMEQELAQLQALKASRSAGLLDRNTPEYRHAYYRAIVDRDDSALSAYNNAMQSALNNKLQREFQEKENAAQREFQAKENKANRDATLEQLKLQKGINDDENSFQWRREYIKARNARDSVYKDPSSSKRMRDDADADVQYYEDYGLKKGYILPASKPSEPAAPAATPTPTPAPAAEPTPTPEPAVPDLNYVDDWVQIKSAITSPKMLKTVADTDAEIARVDEKMNILEKYKNVDAFKEKYIEAKKALENEKLGLQNRRKDLVNASKRISDIKKKAKLLKPSQIEPGEGKVPVTLDSGEIVELKTGWLPGMNGAVDTAFVRIPGVKAPLKLGPFVLPTK